MVSSLPNELILDILELAANASPASALNLCLLSSNRTSPIRYAPFYTGRSSSCTTPKSRPSPGPWSLQHTAHFRHTRTRTLWVLYTSRSTAFYAAMEPVTTTCEALEELACSADWLLDRLYQNQGRRSALAGFTHLKCLRIFDADALSVSQIISTPITHLHLVEPFKGGMKTFLSDVAPSLHSPAVLCLESLTPTTTTLGFSPKHITSLLRVFPSSTSITIKLDVSACSPGEVEVERIASGFQGLAANDPRLSVKLNTIRANLSLLSVNSESPSTIGQRYLHAIDEESNEWA